MAVLIITFSKDNESIRMVTEAVEERGGKVFRFDTDRFPTEVKLDIYYGKGAERVVLTSEQGDFDLSEVSAVWYRRVRIGKRISASMDPQLRSASVEESRRTVQGMIVSLLALHMDSLESRRLSENKQLQLQIAREIGLDTPRTLTSNNPAAVRAFAAECEGGMIAKMLSSFAIYEEGEEKVVFTTPVKPEDLDDLDGLSLCPMTFQERVPKALELRVTIVGRRVFAASIDSQKNREAQEDWRRQGREMIRDWQPYDLPDAVAAKLLELMARFGLRYGAIDVIVTPDGRHVFLEVNPVGEFFWLERAPGLPISSAIADTLLELEGGGSRGAR
jgi:MvdD family ATP-grasp ribosomal peptide maturase